VPPRTTSTERPQLKRAYNNKETAEAINCSTRTLSRLDAKNAGPKFFWVGHRKRRTEEAIRKFQEDNAA
jgi:hypothetical protein